MWADIRKYKNTPGGKIVTADQQSKLRYIKMYNNLSRVLAGLRKQEEFIYKHPTMPAEQKRAKLKTIRMRKNDITKKRLWFLRMYFEKKDVGLNRENITLHIRVYGNFRQDTP